MTITFAENTFAVVTGANRGIGKQVAEILQESGAHVLACARSHDEAFLDWIESRKHAAAGDITPIQLDLANEESIKSAIKEIRAVSAKIDILVNNAGVGQGSLFQMTPMAALRDVFEVNFFGTIALSQGISRLMSRNKTGTIINVSSSVAQFADPGTLAYGCSKAALNRATESMATELGPLGIRVNAIAPGVVDTDMAAQMDEDARDKLIRSSALKRAATPRDVADLVLFLASDHASHITGETIKLDGGIV